MSTLAASVLATCSHQVHQGEPVQLSSEVLVPYANLFVRDTPDRLSAIIFMFLPRQKLNRFTSTDATRQMHLPSSRTLLFRICVQRGARTAGQRVHQFPGRVQLTMGKFFLLYSEQEFLPQYTQLLVPVFLKSTV